MAATIHILWTLCILEIRRKLPGTVTLAPLNMTCLGIMNKVRRRSNEQYDGDYVNEDSEFALGRLHLRPRHSLRHCARG